MPRYVYGRPAGDLLEQAANDPEAGDIGPATHFGVWEVTMLDQETLLERIRLWGVFESEEKAKVACQELSDRFGGPKNDAHSFLVGGMSIGSTPFWKECGFKLSWAEVKDEADLRP